MSLIWFLVVGLFAGLLARAIVPGRQSMGLVATLLLGVVGSFLGGLVGQLFSRGDVRGLAPAGLVMSVVGAIVVLLVVGWAGRRRVIT